MTATIITVERTTQLPQKYVMLEKIPPEGTVFVFKGTRHTIIARAVTAPPVIQNDEGAAE